MLIGSRTVLIVRTFLPLLCIQAQFTELPQYVSTLLQEFLSCYFSVVSFPANADLLETYMVQMMVKIIMLTGGWVG